VENNSIKVMRQATATVPSSTVELVSKAKAILSSGELGRLELWRAYVSVEYAILDLKLRSGLEGQPFPPHPTKKTVSVELARKLLDRVNTEAKPEELLHDLRVCRDVLKALVAGYGRRSTTS
jgi:hypothetical protein